MILDALVRRPARGTPTAPTNAVTLDAVGLTGVVQSGETAAMKLAAVNRCLEVLSDSVGPARSRCSMTMTSTLNSFATVMMKPAVLTAMSLLTPFALAQSLGMRFAPLL